MNHGDVYWVDLPDRGGREQRGRRPAVIWQDMSAFAALPTVLIIPLTSRLDALRFDDSHIVKSGGQPCIVVDDRDTSDLAATVRAAVAAAQQAGVAVVRVELPEVDAINAELTATA